MNETITIPSRYCGPAASGNGGYSCGVIALALTDGPAEVTLRRPPPLDRPLRVERSHRAVAIHDGSHLVAEGRTAGVAVELPPPVTFDEARRAADAFDVDDYGSRHLFPTCFVCGPARLDGDGLRLFPAPTRRGDRLVVWPWVPDASISDEDGLVPDAMLWAALDCPGGFAWLDGAQSGPAAVLGRMTAAVYRRPRVGERLVVAGWPVTADGRKRSSGSVVWSADGTAVAASAATWMVLDGREGEALVVAPASPHSRLTVRR